MGPYLPYLFTPGRRDTTRVVVKIAGKELIAHFDHASYLSTTCTGLFYPHGRALPTPNWLRRALADQYVNMYEQHNKEKGF